MIIGEYNEYNTLTHTPILPVENATIIYKYILWNAIRSVISCGNR